MDLNDLESDEDQEKQTSDSKSQLNGSQSNRLGTKGPVPLLLTPKKASLHTSLSNQTLVRPSSFAGNSAFTSPSLTMTNGHNPPTYRNPHFRDSLQICDMSYPVQPRYIQAPDVISEARLSTHV